MSLGGHSNREYALAAAAAGCLVASVASAADRDTAIVLVNIRVKPVAWIEFPDGFDFHLHVPKDHGGHGHGHGHDKKGKKKGHDKGKGHDSHGNGHGYGHHSGPRLIAPVVIPFKVVGNTVATISAKPEEFLRIKSGAYLGKAVRVGGYGYGHWHSHGHQHGHHHGGSSSYGDTLGYQVIVQFPIPSWGHASPGSWEVYLASFLSGFAKLPGLNNKGTPTLSANLSLRPRGTFGVVYIVSKVNWTTDGKEADEGKYGGSVQLTLTPSN